MGCTNRETLLNSLLKKINKKMSKKLKKNKTKISTLKSIKLNKKPKTGIIRVNLTLSTNYKWISTKE